MTTAWLFPGQGAQSVGMGREFYEAFPECRALFEQASETLGYDVAHLCFEGPLEDLTRSDRAQPAIFTVSAVALAALRRVAPDPETAVPAAGLSSGEWAALYAAGVIDFETALQVLAERGRFMQEACDANPGGMISVIGLDRERLQALCEKHGGWVANLNAPEQTVLSAPASALDAVEAAVHEAGARKAIRLNVAGAFHSPLMAPAAEKLEQTLQSVALAEPKSMVVSNVTAKPHGGPEDIRARMVEQIVSPVRWVDCMNALKADGVRTYFELGPGRVLAGLAKRIDKAAVLHTIHSVSGLDAAAGRSAAEK